MIIAVVMLIAYYFLFNGCISTNRKLLSLLSVFFYVIYSVIDYIWLVDNISWPFHPSDPSAYYVRIVGKSFGEVLNIEGTNLFYFIVNWLTYLFWNDPFYCSAILRLDNILVYSVAYLLVSNKCKDIGVVDFILLFNPYVFITVARNVRDCYIILFVIIVISALGLIPNVRIKKLWLFVGCLLLYITRPILLALIVCVVFFKKKEFLSKKIRYMVYILLVVVALSLFPYILIIVSRQMVSAINYIGEDTEKYIPLLSGQISLPIVISLVKRLSIGLISMMFTPHPINYYIYMHTEPVVNGVTGIYTYLDNIMIFVGSLFNYILIIPVVLSVLKQSILNKYLLFFAMSFVVLYVVAYIGVVDIRNRNTAVFLLMLSLLYNQRDIKFSFEGYLLTAFVFCGIYWFSIHGI